MENKGAWKELLTAIAVIVVFVACSVENVCGTKPENTLQKEKLAISSIKKTIHSNDIDCALFFELKRSLERAECGNVLFYRISDGFLFLQSGIDKNYEKTVIETGVFRSLYSDDFTFYAIGGLDVVLLSVGQAYKMVKAGDQVTFKWSNEVDLAIEKINNFIIPSRQENITSEAVMGLHTLVSALRDYLNKLDEIKLKGKAIDLRSPLNIHPRYYGGSVCRDLVKSYLDLLNSDGFKKDDCNITYLLRFFRSLREGTIPKDAAQILSRYLYEYAEKCSGEKKEEINKIADSLCDILQYIRYSLHTEVQLSYLKTVEIFRPVGDFIFSLKDPCCSCIQLSLMKNLYDEGIRFLSITLDNDKDMKKKNGYTLTINELGYLNIYEYTFGG